MERRVLPRPQRILVVDDSSDVRQLWKVWLGFWGFLVDEAENGCEAIRKARAQRPEVILMDVAMPVLDGISATALLKADQRTADVPVLAISANVFPPIPARALAAGCEVFVPKPVDPDDLIEHVRAAIRRQHDPARSH